VPLSQFAAQAPRLLDEIQQGLFDKAREFRDAKSARLSSQADVLDFFAEPAGKGAGDKGGAEKGGFAHVHVADDPAVTAVLDPLKVTVRCIPMDGPDEPGACIVTGQPVPRRSVLARSY